MNFLRLIQRKQFQARLGLVLILLVGWGVRAWGLGELGLRHDEALSHYYALQSVSWILTHSAGFINHPPLFFLLLKGWLKLVPDFDQVAVEYLNVVLSLVSLWVFYVWTRLIFERKLSLALTFVLVIHPFHVHYSTDLRMYPLAFLSMTCVGYFTTRMVGGQAAVPRLWLGWLLSALMSLYSHSFTGVYLFFVLVALGFHSWYRKVFSYWLITGLLLAVLYGPWLYFVLNQVARITSSYWIPTFGLVDLLKFVYWQAGNLTIPDSPWMRLMEYALLAVVFFIPLLWSIRSRHKQRVKSYWMIALGPVFCVILLSTQGQSVFLIRSFFFGFPYLLVLLGIGYQCLGVSSSHRLPPAKLLFLVFLLFLSREIYALKVDPPRQYLRRLPSLISRVYSGSGPIVHLSGFTYYPSLFEHRRQYPEYLLGRERVT